MPDSPKSTSSQLSIVPKKHVFWSIEHEKILSEWADKAMCYRWLHAKATSMYTKLNIAYTIPVIIISTLTGTANFAQDRVPESFKHLFVMIVGGFNLLAGIISTIQQFLKIAQLKIAHSVATIEWDKLYRNIKIELAKHPNERTDVTILLGKAKEEYDRLMETSPNIPDKIIVMFKKQFPDSGETDKDNKKLRIIKPEICDSMTSTKHFIHPWNAIEGIETSMEDIDKQTTDALLNEQNRNAKYVTDIKNFIRTFVETNNRTPLRDEIIDNLKDVIERQVLITLIENHQLDTDNIV